MHSTFIFDSYEWQGTKLFLRYLSDNISFTETWDFPGGKNYDYQTLNKISHLLHLLAGVSYYKAFLPKEIKINYKISKLMSDFLNKTYLNGLGEFSYQNKVQLDISFPFNQIENEKISYQSGIVIPLGGGKDSLTSVSILKENNFRLISVNENQIFDNLSKLLNKDLINPIRQIDPKLIELNNQGALNGHVPISAILAASFLVAGIIYEFDTVIMSNENSSNFGNTTYNGREINHQYSKSFEFETDFRNLIKEDFSDNFNYFSLLRPLSELDITRIFAKNPEFLNQFTSCNKAFKLFSKSDKLWCGDCPKCRFVFLALSNFIPIERVTEMFSKNLLNDNSQIEGYQELLGYKNIKPFECVGEIEECRILMNNLKLKHPELSVPTNFPLLSETQITSLDFANEHYLNQDYLKLVYEAYRS